MNELKLTTHIRIHQDKFLKIVFSAKIRFFSLEIKDVILQ